MIWHRSIRVGAEVKKQIFWVIGISVSSPSTFVKITQALQADQLQEIEKQKCVEKMLDAKWLRFVAHNTVVKQNSSKCLKYSRPSVLQLSNGNR